MKTVLGLDQATNYTGAAVWRDGRIIEVGTIDTAPRRFDSVGARFLRLERAVRNYIEDYKPALVVIEEHQRHNSVQAAQMLGAAAALICKVAAEYDVPVMGVPVKTLKKFWTGTGAASKELMLAVSRKKCPDMKIDTDDEADACALASWGAAQI